MSETINAPASARDREAIAEARACTREMIELRQRQLRIAAERRKHVLRLVNRGHSLATIAAWLGITKGAVQKITAG